MRNVIHSLFQSPPSRDLGHELELMSDEVLFDQAFGQVCVLHSPAGKCLVDASSITMLQQFPFRATASRPSLGVLPLD